MIYNEAMLEKYLEDLGLSDKEAKVYLALLQVDNSSVLDIAKKTSIKRPTVYVTLESLAKKGLVSETTVGKKTYYLAESPERLETFIQRQKVIFEEKERRVKEIISQVKTVQRETGERPVVQYFEGKEGIHSMNDSLYQDEEGEGGTAYLVYSRDLLDEVFPPEERNKFKKTRLKKHIKSRVLYNYSKGEIPSDETGERRKIDMEKYPFKCDISIYKDRVRIAILGKKLSGIFIKSQEFADTLRSLFRLGFDSSEKK